MNTKLVGSKGAKASNRIQANESIQYKKIKQKVMTEILRVMRLAPIWWAVLTVDHVPVLTLFSIINGGKRELL
jgi:hypothetical protein